MSIRLMSKIFFMDKELKLKKREVKIALSKISYLLHIRRKKFNKYT